MIFKWKICEHGGNYVNSFSQLVVQQTLFLATSG